MGGGAAFWGAAALLLILALLAQQLVSRHIRLRRTVAQRTRELEQANAQLRTAHQLLEMRVEERTQQLSTLLEISRSVATTLEVEPLLGLILDQLKKVVDYDGAAILTLQGDGLVVRQERRASRSAGAGRALLQFPPEGRLSQQILVERRPLIIADLQGEEPLALLFRQTNREWLEENGGVRSWMALPLMAGRDVIGMLACEHGQPGRYTPRQAELALALAGHATVALENARLFRTIQRRADQFYAINQVGQRISKLMNLDQLFAEVVQLIQQTFGYYHVGIGLVEGGEVVYRVGAGALWGDPAFDFHPRRLRVGEDGMSGYVAATGEPLLARDVSQEPHYVHMAHSQTRSELVLPVRIRGEVAGVLDIQSQRLDAFDETDRLALQSLADQIGIAMQNARLYQQAGDFAALHERQKLARELHDSVSQALYGIALGTQTALTVLEQAEEGLVDAGRLANPLQYTMSLAEAGLAEMRALIFELRPESLEQEGLVAALQKQAAALQARHHLAVHTCLGEEPPLSLEAKQALYRFSQEALHNIVKHARASRATISLRGEGEALVLEISDDGRGFDLAQSFPGHLGLHSMRERIEGQGGAFHLESAPGAGTTVRATLALSTRPQPVA